jgi:transcriptional regulator with XRE-family HTH domain
LLNVTTDVITSVVTFRRGDGMIFCDAVKKVREVKGYSQEQLARELNVSFATINRWENRKTEPSRLSFGKFMEFCEQNNVDVIEGEVN